MSLSYKVINSFGVMGLLPGTTDLRKETSWKYTVVPSWSNLSEIAVIVKSSSV